MLGTEHQQSFFDRISGRRSQVMSMEGSHEQELEEFERFQRNVSQRFSALSSSTENLVGYKSKQPVASTTPVEPLLSIAWLRSLFDVFLCCEAEFKSFLVTNRDRRQFSRPPLDRLIAEYLDRSVKFLDICNAVSLGIDTVRQCQRFAEIVVSSLSASISEGRIKRARKALTLLRVALTADERGQGSGCVNSPERSWSVGKKPRASSSVATPHLPFRSSSSVSKNWSAAGEIQAMSAGLTAPRGGVEATTIRAAVYMMSVVMVFTTWAMVAALPCQDRSGLASCFQVPRHVGWSQGMVALHELIGDGWKRKEKNKCGGLLKEMRRLEKLGDGLMEICNGFEHPSGMEAMVGEMGEVCRTLEEGLDPLHRQIREIFHRVARSRGEILEVLVPHFA